MSLITCPECTRQVSGQAITCPQCGFPLAQSQAPNLAAVLCSGTWLATSRTLVDAQLAANFSPNFTFQGQTTPDPNRVVGVQLVARATFHGTWQVAGSQLFLEFPLTMSSGTSQTQIALQFTRITNEHMSGVDRFLRPWEWQKVGLQQAPRVAYDPQAALSTTLMNLADMRHQMLKEIAKNFGEKEAAAKDAADLKRKKKKGKPD